jgi:hypothetical protein
LPPRTLRWFIDITSCCCASLPCTLQSHPKTNGTQGIVGMLSCAPRATLQQGKQRDINTKKYVHFHSSTLTSKIGTRCPEQPNKV